MMRSDGSMAAGTADQPSSTFSQNISGLVALHVELASNPDSKPLVDQHQSKTEALRAEARDLSSKIKACRSSPLFYP